MKRKILAAMTGVALAGCIAAQAAVAATSVSVNDRIKFSDGPGASPGGAFLLTIYNAAGTVVKGSFESFCLEKDEFMSFTSGPAYKVGAISTEARNGGSGGEIPLPYPHDPLDVRTAWLYTQYIENPGALNAVAGWSALSAIDKGTQMQKAIWSIEQEIGSVTGVAANLIAAAGAAGWTNTGRVFALNVTTLTGGAAQDQLYIAPIPEPEIYAMLGAGLGLMGFVARRRKKASAV